MVCEEKNRIFLSRKGYGNGFRFRIRIKFKLIIRDYIEVWDEGLVYSLIIFYVEENF